MKSILAWLLLALSANACADLFQSGVPGLAAQPKTVAIGQNGCFDSTVTHLQGQMYMDGEMGCMMQEVVVTANQNQQCPVGYYLAQISQPTVFNRAGGGKCDKTVNMNYTYTCCLP